MVFIASPVNIFIYVYNLYNFQIQIKEDEKSLVDIAKQLKKNKVSVDIINLCQSGDN